MPTKENITEEYLTLEQARAELSVSRRTMYNLIGDALITPIKMGWSTLFRRKEIEELKQARELEE